MRFIKSDKSHTMNIQSLEVCENLLVVSLFEYEALVGIELAKLMEV